jgi:hypothetical protein
MNKDKKNSERPLSRSYRPLSSVLRGPVCPRCRKQLKTHEQLQEHLNTAHPGWADDVVKRLGIIER